MDVAVHHRHHIVLDPVTVAGVLAVHDHLGAHRIGLAGGEGVLAVGLLEAAADPVDADLPELGGDRLVDLLVLDALHLGLEVSAHLEAAFHALVVLFPDTTTAVAAEARGPGVAVFVGRPEGSRAVGARANRSRARGDGHGKGFS